MNRISPVYDLIAIVGYEGIIDNEKYHGELVAIKWAMRSMYGKRNTADL